jgi:hypothetical protein
MILNTQQIILLCLLVSFVTSIATGITVVSLMQQTAEPVTQTINRVIERTVETVASQEPLDQIRDIITQAPKPEKEVVTVVVNQEDQTINAVAKNEASIARIYTSRSTEFVTMGVVVNAAGHIVVDKRMVNKILSYTAQYGGRSFTVRYKSGSETSDFVLLEIQGESPNDFVPATFGDSSALKPAQSVISLSGSRDTSVSTAAITSLPTAADGTVTTIKTSVDPANVLNGSVLLNLSGSIVGIKLSTAEERTTFMPSSLLKAQISAP